MVAIMIFLFNPMSLFNNCQSYVFQSYCTALYCPFLWSDYKKSTFRKIRVTFNNAYITTFGFPKEVVPVLCMLNIIFVILKQQYRKAYMGLYRD